VQASNPNSLGASAAEAVDEKRGSAAGRLDAGASVLRDKAENLSGGERVADAARTATNAAGSAADYVRENDLKGMMDDARRLVKNNPGAALLTATALGFLIARVLSRK
jgi:ElaB/YqjD/DUF883 family membrane-anchored ribosome-binding protein